MSFHVGSQAFKAVSHFLWKKAELQIQTRNLQLYQAGALTTKPPRQLSRLETNPCNAAQYNCGTALSLIITISRSLRLFYDPELFVVSESDTVIHYLPFPVLFPSDSVETFEELKTEVSKLYTLYNVHEHQVSQLECTLYNYTFVTTIRMLFENDFKDAAFLLDFPFCGF